MEFAKTQRANPVPQGKKTQPGVAPRSDTLLGSLAVRADQSPATNKLAALQRHATDSIAATGPIQRIVGLGLDRGTRVRDMTGRRGRILGPVADDPGSYQVEIEGEHDPEVIARTDLDLDGDAGAAEMPAPDQNVVVPEILPDVLALDAPAPVGPDFLKTTLSRGLFEGTLEIGPARNWADLHVKASKDGHVDPADLIAIFEEVYEAMAAHHGLTGVPGTLEWHPTGAVVTKQIVELLGGSLGGWFQWVQGTFAQKRRKKAAKRSGIERDKQSSKIDRDLVPEHMHFLKSLRGKEGIGVSYQGWQIPAEILEKLRDPAILDALSQEEVDKMILPPDMMGDDPYAEASMDAYEAALLDDEQEAGPSLIIMLDYSKLPSLIKTLKSRS